MLLSCIMAFFLNYFVFLNTTLNSALTQTICGNLKVCNAQLLYTQTLSFCHSHAILFILQFGLAHYYQFKIVLSMASL